MGDNCKQEDPMKSADHSWKVFVNVYVWQPLAFVPEVVVSSSSSLFSLPLQDIWADNPAGDHQLYIEWPEANNLSFKTEYVWSAMV